MKLKNLQTLRKFEKYGEYYNPAVNYNDAQLKRCNYGRLYTTRPTARPSKIHLHDDMKTFALGEEKPIVALCGASIIQGLKRYHDIWDTYFAPLSAINLGIGGDRTENILWRMEDFNLPPTVEFLVIHCGTNNLKDCQPSHIADGVLAIGVMAKKKNNNIKVIVTGLLHCDLNDHPMRTNVAEVNKILRRKCSKFNFVYAGQDADWITEDTSLNMDYYYKDHIHLNHRGNVKFANSIIRKIKAMSSSPLDIIMRIPSTEVPHIDIHSLPSPSSVPPSMSESTMSYRTPRVSSHVIDVPGTECDYDHAKAMAHLSQHAPYYVPKRARKCRPRQHLHVSSLSQHTLSSSVPSPSPHSHSSSSPPPSSCPSSPTVVSRFTSSFNFLMMLLSYFTLPLSLHPSSPSTSQSSTYSCHKSRSTCSSSCHKSRSTRSSSCHLSRSTRSSSCHLSPSLNYISLVFFFIFIFSSSLCTYLILHLFNIHTHSNLTMTDDMTDSNSPINITSLRYTLSASNKFVHFLLFFSKNLVKHYMPCRKQNVGILDTFNTTYTIRSLKICIVLMVLTLSNIWKLSRYILHDFSVTSKVYVLFLIEKYLSLLSPIVCITRSFCFRCIYLLSKLKLLLHFIGYQLLSPYCYVCSVIGRLLFYNIMIFFIIFKARFTLLLNFF